MAKSTYDTDMKLKKDGTFKRAAAASVNSGGQVSVKEAKAAWKQNPEARPTPQGTRGVGATTGPKAKNPWKQAGKRARGVGGANPFANIEWANEPGGPGDGGGGEGEDAWDPQPWIDRYNWMRGAALASLDETGNAWNSRLDSLKAEQMRMAEATQASIAAGAQEAQAQASTGLDPLRRDLAAQGVDPSALNTQAGLNQQMLEGYSQRQNDLAKRFQEINNRSFLDRSAIATGTINAQRADVNRQTDMAIADLLAGGDGTGGGGGGGRGGYGGGGGSSDITAGDAAALAKANTDLQSDQYRTQILGALGRAGTKRGVINWITNSKKLLDGDGNFDPNAVIADFQRFRTKAKATGKARRQKINLSKLGKKVAIAAGQASNQYNNRRYASEVAANQGEFRGYPRG